MKLAVSKTRTFSFHILVALHEAQFLDMTYAECLPLLKGRSENTCIRVEPLQKYSIDLRDEGSLITCGCVELAEFIIRYAVRPVVQCFRHCALCDSMSNTDPNT